MSEYKDHVMVALLPTTSDWCKIELPHLTLVYAGKVKDHKPSDFNKLAKDASALSMIARPLTLRVMYADIFGDDDEKVDVLRLQPTAALLGMRSVFEEWNASEHPFNPHVTVGPMGSFISNEPTYLVFDRIMVAWGDKHLTFWLDKHPTL